MPLNDQGFWAPDLFGKQWEILHSQHRALLVSGNRLAAKSVAVLNKICRHLWDVPGARVSVFARILKHSKDAGQWKNLTERVVPEWIAAGIGMKFTTQNRTSKDWGIVTDGQTRTSYFKVTNRHGGEGTCLLYSLDDDNEAELRLRDAEFSMIYVSELSNFKTEAVLSLGLPCLRMRGLRYDQHQWIADTNPAEEMEASWIYQKWFVQRVQPYAEYAEEQRKLKLDVMEENAFLGQQKLRETGSSICARPSSHRYAAGRASPWKRRSGNSRGR